jgi:hypothetical protein
MCRASFHHAFHYHISSATLFQRLNIMDLGSSNHNRILHWAGISKEFDEWIAIANDRSKWIQLTHSIPKLPDA